MKRKKLILIFIPFLILTLIIIIFLSGPRVKVDDTISLLNLPDDLDSYLKESEQKIPNLKPNTKKTIIWKNKDKSKTEFSIIYIHGFSATRQETVPLSEIVANNIDANIFYTRLTAHGQGSEEFATVKVNDWLNDAVEGLEIGKRIGNKVILIGMSTGAPLVMWLADKNPDIAGAILLSPNLDLADKNSKLLLLPWGNLIAQILVGKYREFQPKSQLHGYYWTTKYRTEGLIEMIGLLDYCKRNINYSGIKIPALFMYTENDDIIDLKYMKNVFRQFGSENKTIRNMSDAKDHVIAGDIRSPSTTGKIAGIITDFINELK